MRYLCVYTENPTFAAALPPPVAWELVEATNHWLVEMKRAGKVTEAAFFAASHGGFAVYEAKSAVELSDLVDGIPARPLCTVEAYPLVEIGSEFGNMFKAQVARMAPMVEKMMAKMPR